MTLRFLRELGERATKTFAQALLATIGGGALNIVSVPWRGALLVAGGATVLSVLTSVASAPFGAADTPSLVRPAEEKNSGT